MKCPYWGVEGFYFWVWVGFFSLHGGEKCCFLVMYCHMEEAISMGSGESIKTIFAAIKGNSFVLDYLGNSSRTMIDLN